MQRWLAALGVALCRAQAETVAQAVRRHDGHADDAETEGDVAVAEALA